MTMIGRREWLHAAAVTAGGAVLAAAHPGSADAGPSTPDRNALESLGAGQAKTPAAPKPGYPSRPAGRIEILFKAPGQSANGMQCTDEGIWTIDVAGSRTSTPGRCKVYLSSYEGKRLRELSPEGTGPSGIGVDADNKTIWIGSTYSREIIRSDAQTGETIEKHFTPGAGVIYRMTTDLPPRPDTYGRSVRPATSNGPRQDVGQGSAAAMPGGRSAGSPADGLGVGRGGAVAGNPGPPAPGTGAHGIQTQAGKLWMAVPPSRMIYRIDPKTWTVEHMFPTVGYRPHGVGIETPDARFLWESDTNMGAFFKRDMATGEVVDSIQLPEGSPFPHGMSVWQGSIYWTDDIGGGMAPVCRVTI
jgi:sugar lactone lactonase YvrE